MKVNSEIGALINRLGEHLNSVIEDREFDLFWSERFDSLRLIEKYDRCMPLTLIGKTRHGHYERIRFYDGVSTTPEMVRVICLTGDIGSTKSQTSSVNIRTINFYTLEIFNILARESEVVE